MGHLNNGQWVDEWYDTKITNGKFVRKDSSFRNWITADGKPGPSGVGGFIAEPSRYHLYISYACPWAHRTLIFRTLKNLEKIISISVVNPYMGSNGWTFEPGNGVVPDNENNCAYLYQLYTSANKQYSGRVTVPILWDKKLNTIVSNESSEIIRMFNKSFNKIITGKSIDFYPKELQKEIDSLNVWIYENINNGVYKAGFATTQDAYNESVTELFQALNKLETILSKQRYLLGRTITECDWRLFPTLIRFDAAYFGHFKCNIKRIEDYPNIFAYVKDLYQIKGINKTVNFDHIKSHYYKSHKTINPTGIVPIGPISDFSGSHNRDKIIQHIV